MSNSLHGLCSNKYVGSLGGIGVPYNNISFARFYVLRFVPIYAGIGAVFWLPHAGFSFIYVHCNIQINRFCTPSVKRLADKPDVVLPQM